MDTWLIAQVKIIGTERRGAVVFLSAPRYHGNEWVSDVRVGYRFYNGHVMEPQLRELSWASLERCMYAATYVN